MERKLATVLFVDLVDSTSLVAGADPEVARRRVTQFFERVSHCVTTHGGIVEKFAGDAVLAAFGIPQAHEDDAERAIRAALAMLSSVSRPGLASSPARSSSTRASPRSRPARPSLWPRACSRQPASARS
jgi:class 3 adenylate cyclase